MLRWSSLPDGPYHVTVGGVCVEVVRVALDRECQSLDELKGPAMIDGADRFVVGVEAQMHAPPWKVGEVVGLALRPFGS
jgi:hypothetical protein